MVEIKSVGDDFHMDLAAIRCKNRYNVKTGFSVKEVFLCEVLLGDTGYLLLFTDGYCCCRATKGTGPTGFYLDKNKSVPMAGDKINLTRSGSVIPVQNSITLPGKMCCG
jgi:hypothetical protein